MAVNYFSLKRTLLCYSSDVCTTRIWHMYFEIPKPFQVVHFIYILFLFFETPKYNPRIHYNNRIEKPNNQ